MNTYNIPRNVKGEGRILFIFSTKALIYTGIGTGIGFGIYVVLSLFALDIIGYIIIAVLGVIGFLIGTFKIPNAAGLEFTKKTGGENIDDIIKRYVKFKMAKNNIYIYKQSVKNGEGGTKDE